MFFANQYLGEYHQLCEKYYVHWFCSYHILPLGFYVFQLNRRENPVSFDGRQLIKIVLLSSKPSRCRQWHLAKTWWIRGRTSSTRSCWSVAAYQENKRSFQNPCCLATIGSDTIHFPLRAIMVWNAAHMDRHGVPWWRTDHWRSVHPASPLGIHHDLEPWGHHDVTPRIPGKNQRLSFLCTISNGSRTVKGMKSPKKRQRFWMVQSKKKSPKGWMGKS